MKNVQEVCKTGKFHKSEPIICACQIIAVPLQKIPVKNEIQTIKRRKRDEIDTKLIMLFCIFMQIYLQIPNNFPNSKFAYF